MTSVAGAWRSGRREMRRATARLRAHVVKDERPPHRLLHVAHHRAGTVWMHGVLDDLAAILGLRVQHRVGQYIRPWADLVFHPVVPAGFEGAGPARGSHLIRDPRDMVVSGYHYHLRTGEAWARLPQERYGGRSYQQHLRALPASQGLLAEIERFAREEAPRLRDWDYTHPEWLELTYEQLRADERATFARLFRHYGLSEHTTARAVALVLRHSPSRRAGRAAVRRHGRRGASGQWREELDELHLERLAELTGDLVAHLGYDP